MNKNKKMALIVAAAVVVIAALIVIVNVTQKPEGGRISDSSAKTEEKKQEDKKEEAKTEESKSSDSENTPKAEGEAEKKSEENSGNSTETSSNQSAETSAATEKVTPTFMYFVSKNDTDYAAGMAAVESLKKEYGDKIKFDIADIDEKPELKENFQLVVGQTPALIMLNTSNDISALEFKCTDTDTLKKDIENALK